MPLFNGAHALIRANLEHFQPNVKTRVRDSNGKPHRWSRRLREYG